MTDKEIIKALKCCAKDEWHCNNNCPFFEKCSKTLMAKSSLDIINRQQAEIERLQEENKILSKNADTAFQDGLNEAQDLYAEQVKSEIKSEAVKWELQTTKL